MTFSRLLTIAAIALLTTAPGQSQDVDAVQVSIPLTRSITIESELLEDTLTLQIGLPLQQVAEDAIVPVVVILDGDVMFAMGTETLRLMSFERSAPPAVTVGISYGLNQWLAGRARDYNPGDDETAGSALFYRALAEDVLPRLHEEFAQLENSPVYLFGHSTAGLGALDAAFHHGDMFAGVAASSPSVESNGEWLQSALNGSTDNLTSKLFVSVGGAEAEALAALNAAQAGLNQTFDAMHYQVFENRMHMAVVPGAFSSAMQWMLSED